MKENDFKDVMKLCKENREWLLNFLSEFNISPENARDFFKREEMIETMILLSYLED